MKNPWNVQMECEFDENYKQIILNIYNKKNKAHKLSKDLLNNIDDKIVEYLTKKYEQGYGFKSISKAIGISYTQCRRLFIVLLKIKTRKGYNVCTEITKKFRHDRVLGNKSPWFDWPNKKPEIHEKNSKGLQGYYKKLDGTYVWLRSTWEYIYAKWLDKNNIKWTFEQKVYKLKNGETYRPDFIILDENNHLKQIVEIKGYFKNRLYKVELLRKCYPKIDIVVIDDINNYCENYIKELKQWKQQRLSASELKK